MLATVVRKFPEHELIVRRLYVRKPEFRSLCEDYATARAALERWQADTGKMEEFQQLVEEIEAEIEDVIHGALDALRNTHPQGET
ncbi:hypothetical protein QO002_003655 [Pararhizobium capsulatum DSM 1112]|uniref:Uncharacterized protein n=1 Tax=Pararhizobium capsulatum DSM 1112 TaxID=1121113 RepID=A0ABU0BXE1_9HYPH|nr:hypothetical protein [Pararhizobium capsulatum]MDQ0321517.1 hypothetical protein [Pararhizobium capsulatum DSM 1112]